MKWMRQDNAVCPFLVWRSVRVAKAEGARGAKGAEDKATEKAETSANAGPEASTLYKRSLTDRELCC